MAIAKVPLIGAAVREYLAFVELAKAWFDANPTGHTFSEKSGPEQGALMAIRWAYDHQTKKTISIMVFKIPYDAILVGDLDQSKG